MSLGENMGRGCTDPRLIAAYGSAHLTTTLIPFRFPPTRKHNLRRASVIQSRESRRIQKIRRQRLYLVPFGEYIDLNLRRFLRYDAHVCINAREVGALNRARGQREDLANAGPQHGVA